MFQAEQRIGEYVLDELIGQSAYAQVWRAHHHMWKDQIAAVKLPTDPTYINNLRREHIQVYRLVHPNIVQPIGFDPHADPPYLIAEYISGGSLRPLVTKRRLTIHQATNILRQILTGLQFAHERGIVHGDIKPDNILLDAAGASSDFSAPGTVKITDFGVGLAAMATTTDAARAQPHIDALAYIAPEQRAGAPPDVKSDVFAVGIVLFEMLTGERPTGAELPGELNASVPDYLNELFRRSYARRERRFESATQFLDAMPEDSNVEHNILRLADAVTEPAPKFPRMAVGGSAQPAVAPIPVEEPVPQRPPRQAPAAQIKPEAGPAASLGQWELEDPAPVSGSAVEEEEDDSGFVAASPVIPRAPSRAQPAGMFDELVNASIKSADDFRLSLKFYFQGRKMDEGESMNIRLRLVKWATAAAGGQSNLDQYLTLSQAFSQPLYVVKLITRTMEQNSHAKVSAADHPGANLALGLLKPEDYKLVAHLSAQAIDDKILDAAPPGPLRNVFKRLSQDARREFWGRVQRQDLLIYTTNAITAEYEFDHRPYRAFLAGNALAVMADAEPFTRIRQEPTKRAAAMLEGDQIRVGIKELHRGLESTQWQAKASVILSALRGKLSAAYMEEAKQTFDNFGWLESMEQASKAAQLAPANQGPLSHIVRVRAWVKRMQLGPGLLIGAAFVALSFLWGWDTSTHDFKSFALQTFTHPFFAAGIVALIATMVSNHILGLRMTRTIYSFYQAILLPLVLAAIIAPVAVAENQFLNVKADIICVIGLIVAIVLDVVIFKSFRRQLIRPDNSLNLVGDEATILGKIETMLDQDWAQLEAHYLALGPLYSYTSVQAAAWQQAAMMERSADEMQTDEVEDSGDVGETSSMTDRAARDYTNQALAAERALIAPARTLLTLINEYAKAASVRQLGQMQSNAAKIEQKGKELAQKLADLDRLAQSAPGGSHPSPELSAAVDRLAQRGEEPDMRLLHDLAETASGFRASQAESAARLAQLLPQAQAAVERLRQV